MDTRDKSVNVRFSEKGLKVLDEQRGNLSRGAYIRKAMAFAINKGFKPTEEL